jgi:hypothetical protein
MKTTPSSSITHDILAKLHDLRSLVENIKAFTTLLWKTKAISEGFFLTAMSLVEEISKQVVGWEKKLCKLDEERKYLIRFRMRSKQLSSFPEKKECGM